MNTGDRDKNAWFEPKRYGYGSGLPLNWRGWLTLGAVIFVIVGFAYIVPRTEGTTSIIAVVGLLAALVLLLRITARRTRGGWRWRWGERD